MVLDPLVRRRLDPLTDAIAERLAARGVKADALTLVGFGLGLAASVAIVVEAPLVALLLFAGNRVLDGLDGAVARRLGPTDRGAFLDITLDFLVYAAVPLACAIAAPERNALFAALLLFTFIGTASSFLAFAVFAERRGLETQARGKKGLFYLGGLAEGTETTVVLLLMCAFPAWFPWLASGFALLCALTTAGRIWSGAKAFGGPSGPG